MKKKYVFIISLAILLMVGTFTIILFSTNIFTKKIGKKDNFNNISNEQVLQSNAKEEKISPGAMLVFTKYYKKCNHKIIEKQMVDKDLINLSEEEFKKLYKDWKIEKFTNKEIELYKEFDGECEEHYLVKSEDGNINIYKIKENGELFLIEKTEIETKYLSDEDIKNLEDGVTLWGNQELNAYIEDFE